MTIPKPSQVRSTFGTAPPIQGTIPARYRPLTGQVSHWRDMARKWEARHKELKRDYARQEQTLKALGQELARYQTLTRITESFPPRSRPTPVGETTNRPMIGAERRSTMTNRIPKKDALDLIFADGTDVKIEGHVVGLNGPTNEAITGRLKVSPELLGWSIGELLDPDVTE